MKKENLSNIEKQSNCLELTSKLLENGQTKELSLLLEPQQTNDCMESKNISKIKVKKLKPLKKEKSVIVESPPQSKKTILKDKLLTCPKSSLTMKSLVTLGQESTLKEKDCDPSLKWFGKEKSNKLWLPIETDCVALHSNCLNGCFKPIEHNSWYSMKVWNHQETQNLQKTSLPLSTFSIAESMVKGSTNQKISKKKPENKMYSRKYRLLIKNKETVKTLKQWFGCSRKTYNMALDHIKKNNIHPTKVNAFELRNNFVTAKSIPKEQEYLLNCPKDVRAGAIFDLVACFKMNETIKIKNPLHKYNVQFRSKKQEASITIPSSAIKRIMIDDEKNNYNISIYPKTIKTPINVKFRNKDIKLKLENIKHDCRLEMDGLNERFYLIIPFTKDDPPLENQERWVALDPGCRTFQTMYSPQKGCLIKIGDNDATRIFRLLKILDKLPDTRKKAIYRLRLKIKHIVDEVHWKTIRYLLDNFDNILIPIFGVSKMVKKIDRKISKKWVRNMLSWRHFQFRMRLITKASSENKNVFVVGEEYTSKTCSNCFKQHPNLGGAKVFKCPSCHLKMDRDGMASRNIFIKNISVIES